MNWIDRLGYGRKIPSSFLYGVMMGVVKVFDALSRRSSELRGCRPQSMLSYRLEKALRMFLSGFLSLFEYRESDRTPDGLGPELGESEDFGQESADSEEQSDEFSDGVYMDSPDFYEDRDPGGFWSV